jgi:hypothetical protein
MGGAIIPENFEGAHAVGRRCRGQCNFMRIGFFFMRIVFKTISIVFGSDAHPFQKSSAGHFQAPGSRGHCLPFQS